MLHISLYIAFKKSFESFFTDFTDLKLDKQIWTSINFPKGSKFGIPISRFRSACIVKKVIEVAFLLHTRFLFLTNAYFAAKF